MSIFVPKLGDFPINGHILRRGLALDLAILEPGDLYDYSESGNNGTNSGATWDGNNLVFSGTDSRVSFAHHTLTDYSISFYATKEGADVNGCVLGSNNANFIRLYPGVGFQAKTSGFTKTFSYEPIAGIRTHYTVTSDGVSLVLYINGEHSQTHGYGGAFLVDNIGQGYGSNTLAYIGSVESLQIYNRALSASEIKALYDNPWQSWEKNTLPLWAAAAVGLPTTGSANLLDGLFERKRLIA